MPLQTITRHSKKARGPCQCVSLLSKNLNKENPKRAEQACPQDNKGCHFHGEGRLYIHTPWKPVEGSTHIGHMSGGCSWGFLFYYLYCFFFFFCGLFGFMGAVMGNYGQTQECFFRYKKREDILLSINIFCI